jgi:hypothetical protein
VGETALTRIASPAATISNADSILLRWRWPRDFDASARRPWLKAIRKRRHAWSAAVHHRGADRAGTSPLAEMHGAIIAIQASNTSTVDPIRKGELVRSEVSGAESLQANQDDENLSLGFRETFHITQLELHHA